MRDLPVLKLDLTKPQTFGNLAAKLDPEERRTLAADLIELITLDETSMGDWKSEAQGYLDDLENEEDAKPGDTEQQGASETQPPSTDLTLSAIIQFSARATDALLGEPDLAKATETGAEPLAGWVSSQLRTKDPNWLLDTDPLVIHMSATGLAWRKRDFDEEDKVFHSHFRPCTDVIINKNVRSVERAPRITDQFERYPYEIERSIQRKKWVDYEPRFDERDPQAPKKFYECDCWLDLDGDMIEEPWSITLSCDDTPEVVRIRPRWSRKTITLNDSELYFNPIIRFYPYRFLPRPDGSFLPMGFGKLLRRAEGSADELLASIVDTAKTEAENGGVFSGQGIGLPDKIEVKNNRITSIPLDGAPLANRFAAWPSKQVSAGSVAALEKIMTLADRIAGTLNLMENAPASMTATLAKGIIDTGTQVQSAVHRRIVASMTQEFKMFVQMADAYDQLPDGVTISQKDGIAVTADPQLATEMHRSAMGGLYMEMIAGAAKGGVPWNVQECQMRFAQVMRLPNPEKLIAPPRQPEATPKEKMDGYLALMKQRTENIKITGAVAVNFTQALLNMVEAAGGMQNNQAALLTMAQLEHAVHQMMQEAGNAGNDTSGMAGAAGNQNVGALPPPQGGGGGGDISGGGAGGPQSAGPGSGIP